MKYVENWQNKGLQCHFCGQTKSVKYTVELTEHEDTKEVPCCNRCVESVNIFTKRLVTSTLVF